MPIPAAQLNSISVSESDVWKALCSLDPRKAWGPDKIGPKLLRECATPLTPPIYPLLATGLPKQFSGLPSHHLECAT